MVNTIDWSQQVGQQFGNYRLLRLLGVRRDAVLYLAQHLYLGTQATLKLYISHLFQNDQHTFLTEAKTLAHLVHPHIVRVLEGDITFNIPFLVMASTTGINLRQKYPVGAMLSLPAIVSFVKQIALALDYAHSLQVLHLDVRPENIWIGHNNDVLLSDFRMTLFSHNSRSEGIQDIMATATYMAPEQMQGRAIPASDQYMLGVVVYEWLCGEPPFRGMDYVEVARQHLYASPPSLSERVPSLPACVEQVVMKALAKESEQRFPTMQAFANALEQSYLAPWDVATPQAGQATPLRPATKNSLTRRRVTIGLAGLVGTAALATAGGMVWFFRQSPPPMPPVGTTLYTYRGHHDVVYGVSWSRDGQSIASWSRDDIMQIWSATTFKPMSTTPMAMVVGWSPDWQWIVCATPFVFQVWEHSTGHVLIEHMIPTIPTNGILHELPVKKFVQWSSDGKYLATALDSTQVWDLNTGKMLFSKPRGTIAWSPDGKLLALHAGTNVQILDVASQDVTKSYNTVPASDSPLLLWSPDGKYMASGSGIVWDATTGRFIANYQSAQSGSMVWSPNSQYIAAFDDSQFQSQGLNKQWSFGTVDPTVHIWNVLTGEDIFVYRGHTAGVNDVAWSPDSTRIASGSADMTVKVWQAVV